MKKKSRRQFLGDSIGLSVGIGVVKGLDAARSGDSARTPEDKPGSNPLPGTNQLTATGDRWSWASTVLRDTSMGKRLPRDYEPLG